MQAVFQAEGTAEQKPITLRPDQSAEASARAAPDAHRAAS
jgi:hypothetical protein